APLGGRGRCPVPGRGGRERGGAARAGRGPAVVPQVVRRHPQGPTEMTRTVLLNSAPLGLLTAPPRRPDAPACSLWLAGLIAARERIIVPEITDYELRRELLRAGKAASVRRLDALAQTTEYLPLTTAAMRLAAELWAKARQQGQPTAADNTIDA